MSPVSPTRNRTAKAHAMREKAWAVGTGNYTRINDPAPSPLDWQYHADSKDRAVAQGAIEAVGTAGLLRTY